MAGPASDPDVRMSGVGGSDAPILMLGEYFGKTPFLLYLEKAGMEEPEDISHKENVYWGTVLEDIVAQEFQRRTDLKVRRDQRTKRLFGHHHMLAHIDRRIVGTKAGLECKTADKFARDQFGETGTAEVPDGYYWQCMHYLAVTGWRTWYLAVLIGGNEFRWYKIERDRGAIERLTAACDEFWQHVLDRTPPPIRHEVDANAAYPESRADEVLCTPEVMGELLTLATLKRVEDENKKTASAAKTVIKKAMGDRDTLVSPTGQVLATWRSTASGNRMFRPNYRNLEV